MFEIEPRETRRNQVKAEKELDLIPILTVLYLIGMAIMWLSMK